MEGRPVESGKREERENRRVYEGAGMHFLSDRSGTLELQSGGSLSSTLPVCPV